MPERDDTPKLTVEQQAALAKHVAGAGVTHDSPFAHLDVPVITGVPDLALLDRWVKPLYMDFFKPTSYLTIANLLPDINDNVAYQLLAWPDWRPRIVGAYLVALKDLHSLTELVGKLLLRSDVTFAGRGYCLALAKLNTPASRQFLTRYLDYYLSREDLWFDQADAMGAISYLDETNGTQLLPGFMDRWNAFVRDKPYWNLSQSCSSFSKRLQRIEELAR